MKREMRSDVRFTSRNATSLWLNANANYLTGCQFDVSAAFRNLFLYHSFTFFIHCFSLSLSLVLSFAYFPCPLSITLDPPRIHSQTRTFSSLGKCLILSYSSRLRYYNNKVQACIIHTNTQLTYNAYPYTISL